ncbi:MAG: amidohydrolase family protein [Bacilli bacterium]|nr:amidohydrolase family protein [Bacilli bacterium]
MKAIINARIYDYKNYIENGYVVFDEQIKEVGKMSSFKDKDYEVIDAKGKLLLPNFVCNHAHIYSIFARGLSLPFNPHNFLEILEQMWWKLDAKITNQITYYSGIAASYEFLLNGVSTVIDHHASGEIIGSLSSLKASVCDVAHMKGIFCFETSDRYNISKCIKENVSFFKENSKNALFGMHASMTLSNETLALIKKEFGNIPLHVHVAESKMDEEDSLKKYNTSIIDRFDKYGLINKDSLIVHGVALSDHELDIIKARGAYMVVNTTSNMNNAVGLPNVKKYLDHGIKVMVGNDGLNSNMASEYMNVYYTSHLLNESPTTLNLGDVLNMINNSYDYVSNKLGIKLGKIEKGYASDFMLVNYSPFTQMDESNAFGHVFFGLLPSFKPCDVLVNGNYEVKNYEVQNKRLIAEFKKCKNFADELWHLVKEEK